MPRHAANSAIVCGNAPQTALPTPFSIFQIGRSDFQIQLFPQNLLQRQNGPISRFGAGAGPGGRNKVTPAVPKGRCNPHPRAHLERGYPNPSMARYTRQTLTPDAGARLYTLCVGRKTQYPTLDARHPRRPTPGRPTPRRPTSDPWGALHVRPITRPTHHPPD